MKKLIAILLVLIVFTGCSKRRLNVGTGSMEPTIPAGSKVVVDFRAYDPAQPTRFDIVVFRPPPSQPPFSPETILCHRIVGLPNEQIELHPGSVLIDGVQLEETVPEFVSEAT